MSAPKNAVRLLWAILLLSLFNKPCLAYQSTSTKTTIDRRACLQGLIGFSVCGFPTSDANAVISSKACASGRGEGCDDLAEGNEFIRSLQEKSAVKADVYAKEARDAYYMKNYPDFFAVVGKIMVKKPDGSFILVEESELKALMQDNKISLEFPKAMGGKVTDLTQKPVMVLNE
ncbi:expressed unknown protein [Seminavis robusta]|uniref:Uncharacterized protein n=1 Tax=Seminavis robusta TaxID=568900 RepID=A0A9N8I0E4_9STRA|nr:expressed unknown protein [Seminavis robusta]|eukprot:Sro2654_g333820.1 n/a (174) ;mRNA; r:9014-9650